MLIFSYSVELQKYFLFSVRKKRYLLVHFLSNSNYFPPTYLVWFMRNLCEVKINSALTKDIDS